MTDPTAPFSPAVDGPEALPMRGGMGSAGLRQCRTTHGAFVHRPRHRLWRAASQALQAAGKPTHLEHALSRTRVRKSP